MSQLGNRSGVGDGRGGGEGENVAACEDELGKACLFDGGEGGKRSMCGCHSNRIPNEVGVCQYLTERFLEIFWGEGGPCFGWRSTSLGLTLTFLPTRLSGVWDIRGLCFPY